ncbi:MAG: AsmA family protein [Acidobacteriaceae bacterium]
MRENRANLDDWRARAREALRHRWAKVVGGIVAAIIILLIVVPFFVNADTFRPTVESEISSALGRTVTMGHLSFSLFSGSLVADNVSIADDSAFSTAPFFQAKSLHIGVSTGALLFHHQVRITKFTASSPQIHLIQGQNGAWNYASLGRGGSAGSSSQQSRASDLNIGELKISNCSVSVASWPSTGKPFVYNKVDLTVRHLSLAKPMPFELSADLPGEGTLKLTGTAGPVPAGNAIGTPVQASLVVKHFDPVAAGAVTPASGVSMVADIDAQLTSDGKAMTASGKIKAENLKLSPHGSPAPQPVNVDFAMTSNLGAQAGQVRDVAIHTGQVAAHVTGTYQMTGQGVTLDLHLSAPSLPVDGLVELLPAVGIRLPSGSSLRGGTLTANLAITGPAAAPQIAGPVEIDNTQLAGFDLGSKIEGLSSLGKAKSSGGGTAIRTLKSDVTSTAQSTQLNNIYGDVPSIGTATGSGTVSAAGALDFQLTAKLNSGGAAGGVMNAVGGVAGNFLHTTASSGIPLRITGTTANPSIRANVGAMLKQQTGGLMGNKASGKSKATGLVKGLLGR